MLKQFNRPQKFAEVSPLSNTLPDQSLSVKEILARFTRGQSVPSYLPSEDDPQELPDDELMKQEVLDPFERRQLALEFEEAILETEGAPSAAPAASALAGEQPKVSEQSPEIGDQTVNA